MLQILSKIIDIFKKKSDNNSDVKADRGMVANRVLAIILVLSVIYFPFCVYTNSPHKQEIVFTINKLLDFFINN